MSDSAVSGDFSVQRASSNAQFLTPDETTTSDRAVGDYRLGRLGGAFVLPTEQGSAVIGISFHQTNTYKREFNVRGNNSSNSVTGSLNSEIAFEAGAITGDVQAAAPNADAVDGEMVLAQQHSIFESGQMNELSFGGTVEVAPNVMVGGGLNISFGSYGRNRLFRETDASDLPPPEDPLDPKPPYDPYFVNLDNGNRVSYEGFQNFQRDIRVNADLGGAGLRFGTSAEFVEGLRAGVLLESPTWYQVTEVFGTQMRTTFDTTCDPNGCVRNSPFFEYGSLTANEFEYTLRTPWRIGGGVQYNRSGFMIAVDAEFVDWTQANLSSDTEPFNNLNRKIRSLDATINTSVGAAYAVEQVAVRSGFSYRPDPRSGSFSDIDGKSTNRDRLLLSAGISYTPTDSFELHLNWLQERSDDRAVPYTGGPSVRENLQRNRFSLGTTLRF